MLAIAWIAGALLPGDRRGGDIPDLHWGERDNAIDVLKRRYAAGKIGQAEFVRMRRTLGYGEAAEDEMGLYRGE